MGRIVESRQGDGLHSTLPQQGSSIWTDGQSWEQVICQSECPWPRPLVHLSQRSGRFPQPCVKAGTKPTNSLALMLCALLKKVFQFFFIFMPEQGTECPDCYWLSWGGPFGTWLSDGLSRISVICYDSTHPHWGNTDRDKDKNTCHLYVCVCAGSLFYFQTDSERNHICHIVFHSLFSLWPRGKACWAFWQ